MTRPREAFLRAIQSCCRELGWPTEGIVVERPKDPSHGDWASPAALMLARRLQRPPREIAQELATGLDLDPAVFAGVEIAGPGFLNARLAAGYLQEVVRRILTDPGGYGRSQRLEGRRVNVEFVSSNPTGPLHVGHARNAALGDAIAALYQSQGGSVTREYYFNDAGRQMDMLGASVYARYQQQWDPGFPFPEEGYQGEYIAELADALAARDGDRWRGVPLEECLDVFRSFAADEISRGIRQDLERFRVRFDVWFNESSLYRNGRLEATVADLRSRDAVYEEEGATWFRATVYGDEKDRVLIKGGGQPTYLLPDLAYHRDKFERGYETAIDVWGADHHNYQVRMQAGLRALGLPEEWLHPVIYQQISIVENGQPVRLSTRKNRMVTLRELLDDIGVDVTRYFLLMRKGDAQMVFDLDLARRQNEENPVYYVQYAHARIAGVFEKLEHPEWDPRIAGPPDSLDRLVEPEEIELLRALEDLPDTIADATDALEPHRITDYLEGLARRFHLWYHAHRFLVDEPPLARARLALARGTQEALASGLTLLGVSAPESM